MVIQAEAPIEVIELERTLLGAMLLDGLSILEGISSLTADDFALDSHRRIFSAITRLHGKGIEVDLLILCDDLKNTGDLNAVGGASYVADITSGIPRHLRAEEYILRIQDRSTARRAAQACEDATQRFRDPSEKTQEICDDLMRIVTGERKQSGSRASEIIGPALKSLEGEDARLIATGIQEIDEITNGGMRTKELWIVGALPSRGKSSILRQLELGALNSGESVFTHTCEMPKDEWLLLHAFALAGIPSWKIRKPGFISSPERDRLMKASLEVERWDMVLDDESGMSIESIIAKSRLSSMRDGTRMVGVDYIQLIRGEGGDLRQQTGNIAMRLKAFAKKHDCCVVALSQLARKGDINVRPTMQDLKESGDLEAHADVIVMPYRPVDTATGKFTGEDELLITKQRNGGIGSLPMTYNVENLRFESRR